MASYPPKHSYATDHHFRRRALPSTHALQRKTLDRNLRNVYEGPDGRVPDLTRLERRGRSPLRFFLVVVVGVGILAAVAWAGQVYWGSRSERFGEELVEMQLSVPPEIRSGETITMKLQLINRSSTALKDVDVLLQYPDGFIPASVDPVSEGTEQRRWRLSTIDGGGEKSITVAGALWGAVNQEYTVRASMLFTPATLRATFRLSREAKLKVKDSIVTLGVEKPEQVAVGQKFTIGIKIANSGAAALEKLALRLRPPEGLFIESTNPATKEGNGIEWNDVSVAASSETTVTVTGNFISGTPVASEGSKPFHATVIMARGPSSIVVAQKDAVVNLRSSGVGVSVIANGVSSSQSIPLTGTIRASIVLANTSKETIKNLVVRLRAESATANRASGVLWKRIEADGKPVVEGQGLLWNPAAFEPLASLEAGKELTIDAQLPLDRSLAKAGTVLKITGSVSIPSATGGSIPAENSASLTLTLVERLEIQARARYYNDDNIALGSGPFPPSVGNTTTLRVFWTLASGSLTLEDVRVVASLPPNASLSGTTHQSVGSLRYDENARAMTWSIHRLSSSSGAATVDFGVTLKPSGGDVGRVLSLTGPATLSARDATDGSIVTRSADALTTQLVDDPEFSDTSGAVRE